VWLREDAANCAALLDAAHEIGHAGDMNAALELIAEAALPSVKGRRFVASRHRPHPSLPPSPGEGIGQ
jgi:hypothetical protein